MKKIILSMLVMVLVFFTGPLILYAAFLDSGWGARPAGMGGAFAGLADDINAPLINPAGIAQIRGGRVSFLYDKPFMGLDNVDIGKNYMGYASSFGQGSAIGLSWASFSADSLYDETTYTISFAKNLNANMPQLNTQVFVGLNLKSMGHSYTIDSRTEDDPVFANGTSKSAFTIDMGLLVKPKDQFGLGLSVKNLTQPDVGLNSKDTVPMEIRGGLAYNMGSFKFANTFLVNSFTPLLDICYRDGEMKPRVGLEAWLNNDAFALRTGYNPQEITFGFSLGNIKPGAIGINFDYAFAIPLELEDTSGTHRVQLTVGWGNSQYEMDKQKSIEDEKTRAERLKREAEQKAETERLQEETKQAKAAAEAARLKAAEAERTAEEAMLGRDKAEEEAMLARQRILEEAKLKALEVKEEERGVVITLRINFAFNETEIQVTEETKLDQVIEILKAYEKYNIVVEGHTDNVGDEAYNLELSEQRAYNVAVYLARKGIKSSRLSYVGVGEGRPVAENNTNTGRALNRRVEFVIVME